MKKQWKYDDKICIGRKQNEETGDVLMKRLKIRQKLLDEME